MISTHMKTQTESIAMEDHVYSVVRLHAATMKNVRPFRRPLFRTIRQDTRYLTNILSVMNHPEVRLTGPLVQGFVPELHRHKYTWSATRATSPQMYLLVN